MVERSQLIQNLRNQLQDGATPSRLIREILGELSETPSSREVQEILAEAFQLPIVRLGPSLDLDRKCYTQGILNRTLLSEIIENRQRWATLMSSSTENISWLDGLQVTSPDEVRRKLAADSYPGLSSESWETLRADEQQTLLVQLTSSRVLSDRLEILSRLVERLQEKIDELEGRTLASSESESNINGNTSMEGESAMEPERFSSVDDPKAQEKFQHWQTDHPNGFYINKKSASRGMLHRARCPHAGGEGDWDTEFGDVTRKEKFCQKDRAALMEWAEKQGLTISVCADCRP